MDHTALGSSSAERSGSVAVVAVIDDDATTREAIQAILEFDGYEVIAFADAVAAQRSFVSSQPNLVILDMLLGQQSGIDVLDQLRLNPITANIPVVVCSAANLSSAELARLERLGCVLLSKPFELDDLLQAAENLTQQAL
jgi:CheY-like chemotaxis protein